MNLLCIWTGTLLFFSERAANRRRCRWSFSHYLIQTFLKQKQTISGSLFVTYLKRHQQLKKILWCRLHTSGFSYLIDYPSLIVTFLLSMIFYALLTSWILQTLSHSQHQIIFFCGSLKPPKDRSPQCAHDAINEVSSTPLERSFKGEGPTIRTHPRWREPWTTYSGQAAIRSHAFVEMGVLETFHTTSSSSQNQWPDHCAALRIDNGRKF